MKSLWGYAVLALLVGALGAVVSVSTTAIAGPNDQRSATVTKVQVEDDEGHVLDITDGNITVAQSATDPCASSSVAKSSVALAHTADTELVALSGSQVIYVCGLNFTLAGTAPSARFITGTGAVCATGTVNETGIMLPAIGTNVVTAGGGYTVFAGAAGAALCIDVGGTTPSAQGVLTYVRQ